MIPIRALMLFAIALLGGCNRPDSQEAAPVADLLLVNADVVTVDEAFPRAEAVAIRDDRILAVGTTEAMSKHRGESSEVIDLQGRMVVPGFIGRILLDYRLDPFFRKRSPAARTILGDR